MSSDYILTIFITLITIVDPLGLIPVYLPIAERFPKEKRKKIVGMAFSISLIVSTVFLFGGKYLFQYLQVSFNSLYIVGGILLFLIGLDMIYARPRRTQSSPEERDEAMTLGDVSVFPLAIPMLSGPGTLAAIVMFSSKATSSFDYMIILAAIVVALGSAAISMIFSEKLLKVFGRTGLNVMDRVIGIILCSLAVQFVINAIKDIVST